jgi:acyl-CoA synthetase (AMP-forming)/AMP-acid ligase II
VGEVAIRGYNVMKGYWNRPEATAEVIDGDGWFKTGDLARIDEEGYFFIVDRKKDMVIRGGYNVYPREIEAVPSEHPAVREAAVIGLPHDDLGEEVAAVVALKPDTPATPDEIRDYVRERVAAYSGGNAGPESLPPRLRSRSPADKRMNYSRAARSHRSGGTRDRLDQRIRKPGNPAADA